MSKLITCFSCYSAFLLFCWQAFVTVASVWRKHYITAFCGTPLPNDLNCPCWLFIFWKVENATYFHFLPPYNTPGNFPDYTHHELYWHLVYCSPTLLSFYKFMPFKTLSRVGVMRCLSRWGLLLPTSPVQSLEPRWYEERADPCNLSSGLHTCAVPCAVCAFHTWVSEHLKYCKEIWIK